MKKVGKRAFWFVLSVLLVLALIAGSAAVGYKWLHHEKRQNIDIETLQNLSGVCMRNARTSILRLCRISPGYG